jgi:hypothetical protein
LNQSAGTDIGCREIFKLDPLLIEHSIISPFKIEIIALHGEALVAGLDLNSVLVAASSGERIRN